MITTRCFPINRLCAQVQFLSSIEIVSSVKLPKNLTMIGLPEVRPKHRHPLPVRKAVDQDISRGSLIGRTNRADRKKIFFSGVNLAGKDRLTKQGKPLLKNLLRDSGSLGNYREAVVACEKRLQRGDKIDNKLLTTILRTFGNAGESDKAIALFKRIASDRSLRVKLDNYHCAAAIHACGVNREWWKALDILDICRRDPRVTPNAVVYVAAMTACMNGKRFGKVQTLFEELSASGLKMDASCYNVYIRAAGKAGKHSEATHTFTAMLKNGTVRPDAITYMAVLDSCAVSGDYERALLLIEEIKSLPRLNPNLKMYTAAVSACIKAKKPMDALEVLRSACRASSIVVKESEIEDSGDISSELLMWKFPGTRFSGSKKYGLIEPPDSLLLGLGIIACSMLPSFSSLAIRFLEQIFANKMTPTFSQISGVIKSLEIDGNTAEAMRYYRLAMAIGLLRQSSSGVDLISSGIGGDESRTQLEVKEIKVDLTGIYGDHIVRTRLRILLHFILQRSRDQKINQDRAPAVSVIVGNDVAKKDIVHAFFTKSERAPLMPMWIENQKKYTIQKRNLKNWVALNISDVQKLQ